jgi:protein-L-isoaspartate(D-aspartate) O-methyltransferase
LDRVERRRQDEEHDEADEEDEEHAAMIDLSVRRRLFAEEIEAVANLRTPALIEALALVPRERFLRAGPWYVRGESDIGGPPRTTPDADPRHVYHNYAIGIDPPRQLFNGAPALIAMAIDALALKPGDRVLHVGAGLGYYSALIAHAVGDSGRLVAIEVDEGLAIEARENLRAMPWVDVRHGDGTGALGEPFDAILINAGVTHPQDTWLNALSAEGRMVLPLTVTSPAMGTISKGLMARVSRPARPVAAPAGTDAPSDIFDLRVMTLVAIYAGIGLRDDAINDQLGAALMRGPFPPLKRLRRDAHEPTSACWVHAPGCCLSLE